MEAEHIEIVGFLKQFQPFSGLPEQTINNIAQQVEIAYYRAESSIFNFGDEIHDLCMIRSGSVEIYRRNGDLYNRLSAGGLFGQMGLLMNNSIRLPVKALEDSLIYFIPESVFISLCDEFETFAYFVEINDHSNLQHAVSGKNSNSLMVSKATMLISREPITISSKATIRQSAEKMTEEGVSSLLIVNAASPVSASSFESKEDGSEQQMVGIITDRDLRTRVVSTGYPLDATIDQVMSTDLITLDVDAYAFEAMLSMLRYNLHHLPILDKGRPVGVIAISDIVRYESQSSLYMVGTVFRQNSVEELNVISKEISSCFVRLVNEDANSHMIGSAMSVIGRSFKQRLLELAEEYLGAPPIPYCFLALGSMARDEQLIITDQDNALILDNQYDPQLHGEYFEALANFVCDGLAACGFSYCTGGIMATNPRWRKTRQEWEVCFADWMDNPVPEALLNCSIFFDLEGVWGKIQWAEHLNFFIAQKAAREPRFLASMARNALSRTPPLGFFKNFVMEQDGQHRNSINLKRRGTAPLADLIRVHALAVGSKARNSFERLDDIIKGGVVPDGRISDLKDALEFISMVRIRHQALDIEAGRTADNNIEPEHLSEFERRNLKDAFQVLSNSQRFLRFRYPS
ncbi:putative nucleotidyltransferase substrate binding domain-containing protein [Neptunomonas antarctica]|uniref:CBS domain-containing protein n=1 Tax=Neptunomonas antarctica TaxID=619304 RepID=A0A1N7K2N7_9GAMM|nr:putative nucleotidyltransferase substrate binding domain-containing protein [Neptunomonas antarctica]SIS55704.1 CBS domain-containing protein [Neptunomonas antarctica]